MSEQAVDLRSTWAVLRRRSGLLFLAALIGGAAGFGFLYLFPPPYTSVSGVLLPPSQAGGSTSAGYDAETQVLIATSSEVLSRAAEKVEPPLTASEAGQRVEAEAPSPSVIQITAEGPTAAQAEALAAAAARSLVDYLSETARDVSDTQQEALQARLDTLTQSLAGVNDEIQALTNRLRDSDRTSAAGRADASALSELTAVRASTILDIEALRKQLAGEDVTNGQIATGANVLEAATPGTRAGLVVDALTYVLGGAALFLVLAILSLVATNQRDPKLRSRDEIADAVGIPVVASLRARAPRSASGWVDLLRDYSPDSTDGWALRQLLHRVLPDGAALSDDGPAAIVVLCLSGDTEALAVGPQIASFAASTGVGTQFLAAQQHESATTLWAACSQSAGRDEVRPGLSVTAAPEAVHRASLSVRLLVLDRETPEPDPDQVVGAIGLLAVGAASVTRPNLADTVIAADRVGLTVHGIVVANPDPLDRTTGRLAPVDRPGAPGAQPTPLATKVRPGAGSSPAAGPRRRTTKGGRQR